MQFAPCTTYSKEALHHGALQVFESGALYDPKVLDIKDDDLMSQVTAAISNVAAASLQLHYPTLASIPHSVINGYKNVLAVAVETEYSFDLADKVRFCLWTQMHIGYLHMCSFHAIVQDPSSQAISEQGMQCIACYSFIR